MRVFVFLLNMVYNINRGLKQPLLAKCQYLSDYSTLVGKVKEGICLGLSRREAISRAVKFCLDSGLMKGYLEERSEEVFNMLALEWNMDDALQARFDDGVESVALNMIRKGMSLDKICELTELPLERIEELADKIKSRDIKF